MSVLSVDLASRRWCDLGIVLLDNVAAGPKSRASKAVRGEIHCEIFDWHDELASTSPGRKPSCIDPEILAGRLNHLANTRGVRLILLDGPQAWKSANNGLAHARVSERLLNTAAKTGLPGMVKPVTYRAFADFCVDVYDALCRRGWKRLATTTQPIAQPTGQPTSPEKQIHSERILIESYPHAAWKSLGLKPLPSKARHKVSDLAESMAALKAIVPLTTSKPPNHDQLQAIVAGLAGLGLTRSGSFKLAAKIFGQPPRREEGHWREGFIALPVTAEPLNMQWMN
jgi:hypothetical protein